MSRRRTGASLVMCALVAAGCGTGEPAAVDPGSAPTSARLPEGASACVPVEEGRDLEGELFDSYLFTPEPGEHPSGTFPAVYCLARTPGAARVVATFSVEGSVTDVEPSQAEWAVTGDRRHLVRLQVTADGEGRGVLRARVSVLDDSGQSLGSTGGAVYAWTEGDLTLAENNRYPLCGATFCGGEDPPG